MINGSGIKFWLDGKEVLYRKFVIRSGFMCPVLIVEIQGFAKLNGDSMQYTNDDAAQITEVFFLDSIKCAR